MMTQTHVLPMAALAGESPKVDRQIVNGLRSQLLLVSIMVYDDQDVCISPLVSHTVG